MKRIDVTKLLDDQLKTLVEHHQTHGRTGEPNYIDAVAEMAKRDAPELDLGRSLATILEAARTSRFISYSDLAQASGAKWDRVRYKMNTHLWAIVCFAKNRNWPMLSAIAVNKQNVDTGKMEPSTLRGFIDAARLLGYKDIVDEAGFLTDQQRQCFEKSARETLVWSASNQTL
jgi:hypothetical protein